MQKKNLTPAPGEKRLASYTLVLTDEQIEKLRDYCESRDELRPLETPYSIFSFRAEGEEKFVLTVYTSRKLLVSGRGTQNFVQNVLEPQITGNPMLGYDEVNHPDWFELHAGLDESGKGDLFGPLVAACVIAGKDAVKTWIAAGVRDSKVVSEKKIFELEKLIRSTPNATVKTASVKMAKYNELYEKKSFGNLNPMLAHFHFVALREALAEIRENGGEMPAWGLLDQFSPKPLVQNELAGAKIDFELRMRTKAESDPVVAAASIVARATYVRAVQDLEKIAKITIPKGCSADAREAGKKIVEKFGNARLPDFVKMHFRTAYEVLGLEAPQKNYYVPHPRKSK